MDEVSTATIRHRGRCAVSIVRQIDESCLTQTVAANRLSTTAPAPAGAACLRDIRAWVRAAALFRLAQRPNRSCCNSMAGPPTCPAASVRSRAPCGTLRGSIRGSGLRPCRGPHTRNCPPSASSTAGTWCWGRTTSRPSGSRRASVRRRARAQGWSSRPWRRFDGCNTFLVGP